MQHCLNMKKILVFLTLCSLVFISCTNSQEDDKEKAEIEKKVSKRDYSITKANAYSDLFLDSMRMEKFIAEKKFSDSIIRRMRSFYNTRNFQFDISSRFGRNSGNAPGTE